LCRWAVVSCVASLTRTGPVALGALHDHSPGGWAVPDDVDRPAVTLPRRIVVPAGIDEVSAGKLEEAGTVGREHLSDDGLDGLADDEEVCGIGVACVEARPVRPVAGIHRP
jgi:hypothetical protein